MQSSEEKGTTASSPKPNSPFTFSLDSLKAVNPSRHLNAASRRCSRYASSAVTQNPEELRPGVVVLASNALFAVEDIVCDYPLIASRAHIGESIRILSPGRATFGHYLSAERIACGRA